MAISLGSNLALHTRLPLDDRTIMETIEEMKDYPENFLPDIAYCFVKSDGKMYVFNRENESTELTGKWRVLEGSGGSGTSITVDTAMSDTSTNPVQNKVIKAYVDSKSVDISADLDNAIQNKTDGIYVEKTKISTDDGNALSKKSNGLFVQDLSDKINQINFAQKTVNEGLDYCYCILGDAISGQTYSINDTFPFTMSKSNNMTCNSSNHSIILKKGKTYRISSDIQCNLTSSNMSISIYNLTKGMNLRSFHKTVNSTASESAGTAIYTPDLDDEEIIVKITSLTGKANGTKKPTDFSYFIAEEIGRAITIDPLEYANSESGIEDTPVGHIIHYMGNNAPKHYLICDGGEYNIVDYPYLAQHFTDEFGSVNYFGGDGTTTFAVPDLSEPSKLTKISPIMTSYTTPSPYVVTRSSVWKGSDYAWRVFDGVKTGSESYTWISAANELNPWICIDLGTKTKITSFKLWLDTGKNKFPEDFTLQGSNDGTNFINIKSFTNVSSMAQASDGEIEFNLGKIAEYRYYKIYVDTLQITGGATYVRISEWEMFYQDLLYRNCIKYEPTYFMKNIYSADSVNYTDEEIQEAVAAVLGGGN